MSILAQIGIVILIVCIVLILIRSNKTLEEVSEEGEHFVDEWAMREERKEERALEREEKKRQKEERKEEKKREKKQGRRREEEEKSSAKSQKGRTDFETDGANNISGGMAYEPDGVNHESDDMAYEPERVNYESDGIDYEPEEFNDEPGEMNYGFNNMEYNPNERNRQQKMTSAEDTTGRADILSMDKYRNPQITLVELDENHRTVRRIPVKKLPFTIGRSKENMLELDDLCVARKHCRIVERNGAFLLEDVGTANKLYVRGEITGQVELEDQLEVYIGNVELRVEMGAARSEHTQLYGSGKARYYV